MKAYLRDIEQASNARGALLSVIGLFVSCLASTSTSKWGSTASYIWVVMTSISGMHLLSIGKAVWKYRRLDIDGIIENAG